MCSCGANLVVEVEHGGSMLRSERLMEEQRADRLLEQFRRDHKLCRINAAAKEAT